MEDGRLASGRAPVRLARQQQSRGADAVRLGQLRRAWLVASFQTLEQAKQQPTVQGDS
jgi:hypothetical protein